ncbi:MULTISPECIES: EAL domain-containing protein [Legionella]|uniref:cyclic-guanylate-specific phosphodiesterase n=1 Tax=Legionella septentrionalis TaxID=2498109 RepID=A0A3S0XF32_9GAMM|nr:MULTISPECIES: EAL domain-containing protein [Legionella]MCP0913698.1 EAL domain-containing protein [Legionella sp. 27cVA30]RUQ80997.1 EAL domain-containing protein [Legionella septentrionalis]RUQ97490.1 EAL domain-containing protein [Legionella septentrionalis]RUR09786.1 EAL domain-containing protein [Legionella septentrionalis]RUR15922.1 EAL domain-containing protein [Legionella septentrionalis]
MRKQEIDYKRVASAAARIKQKGKEPSVTDICDELGLLSVTPELITFLEQWYHNQPEFKRKKQTPLTENIKLNKPIKEIELEKSLSLLRATLESTADGIMMVNGQGQVVDWNQKFVDMWRIPSHLMEAGPEKLSFDYILEQLIEPEKIIADVQFLYQNPEWEGELPELHFKDGRIFERYTQPQRIGAEIVGRVYSFRDVTQKRIADDELRIRERAIEASTHGIAIIDIVKPNQPIIYINNAFERITGYSERHILGKDLTALHSKNTDQTNQKRIDLAIREEREETVELELMRRNGELFWCELSLAPVKDSFNQVKHYVGILNDVTLRREMEEQLLRQATHDALTELPNRVLLLDRVEQAILQAKKNKSILAFLFLDLDRFKMTNDTLGHGVGDKLLQAVANRLLIATSDLDTVARFGGDEFVILIPELRSIEEGEKLAQEILNLLEKPFKVGQHSLKITASIGLSFFPRDGMDYESLMKNADLSMYHAKDSGRNTYRIFEPEMNRRVVNHVQIDNALRYALQNKEFYLVYQPLMDLKRECVVGVEALLRWNSKVLGHVSPLDFIPIAEENGMILEIGPWVIEEACTQLMRWHNQGLWDLTVAVNISGRQLHQADLPEQLTKILHKTSLPAKFLELELTESLLVENIDHAVEIMYKFKDMGVKLAIDDFGTGYSSLSYLKQFPVDKLKIDQSFIKEMVSDANDAAIVKAIINLAHSLNLQVLAEGVENEYQKNFILNHGCDFAQGYYFKPPNKAELIIEFLKNYSKCK